MLDDLKEEAIVNKVGGRFKLSTLIQKRMVALNTGARPLVEVRGGDKMAIVVQEILQDKIYLDLSGQLQTRGDVRRRHPPRHAQRHLRRRQRGRLKLTVSGLRFALAASAKRKRGTAPIRVLLPWPKQLAFSNRMARWSPKPIGRFPAWRSSG